MLAGAQDSARKALKFSGYVEGYFGYDFGKPADKTRPSFFYSFNRHNAPRINMAMVRGAYNRERFYINAGLMAGTYSSANLARENGLLKNIYELNAGVQLAKGLWMQAGVMPSHIGFESAIGADCWNLTRSVAADNSPYVETGLKLGLERGKWYMALLLLNGWQRIRIPEAGVPLSFGHQLQFKPSDKWLLNSSSFVGSDYPPAQRKMRYFHNLYVVWQTSGKWALQGGFDIGAEQKSKGSSAYNTWYTLLSGLRYTLNPRWTFSARVEYYHDPGAVLVSSDTGLPFSSFGASVNVDHYLLPSLLLRLEGRVLAAGDQLYLQNGRPVSGNQAITASVSWRWN